VPEKLGTDAALGFSLPAGPAAEGVCAKQGIAADVAAIIITAKKRRKSRCIRIGRLPLMSVSPV